MYIPVYTAVSLPTVENCTRVRPFPGVGPILPLLAKANFGSFGSVGSKKVDLAMLVAVRKRKFIGLNFKLSISYGYLTDI